MVRDKQTLVEFADALRSKLRHFEELDNLSADIARVCTHPEGDGFLPLLQRLDDCSAYVASSLAQHAESDAYVVKVRKLQAQAMAAIHQRVAAVLRRAFDKVVEVARQGGGRGAPAAVLASLPAADEPAVLVVQFRAVVETGVKGVAGCHECLGVAGLHVWLGVCCGRHPCACFFCELCVCWSTHLDRHQRHPRRAA